MREFLVRFIKCQNSYLRPTQISKVLFLVYHFIFVIIVEYYSWYVIHNIEQSETRSQFSITKIAYLVLPSFMFIFLN